MIGQPLTQEERERAKVLHAGGASGNKIAKNLGRNRRTVQKFLDRPETREQVNVQREELAGMFDSVAHRIVDSVNDADISKANLVQKMTSAGIAVDKAALLRGELPPAINVTVLTDVLSAIRQRREENNARSWREEHARIVTEAKDCIVANCPVHSPALPAPDEM